MAGIPVGGRRQALLGLSVWVQWSQDSQASKRTCVRRDRKGELSVSEGGGSRLLPNPIGKVAVEPISQHSRGRNTDITNWWEERKKIWDCSKSTSKQIFISIPFLFIESCWAEWLT